MTTTPTTGHSGLDRTGGTMIRRTDHASIRPVAAMLAHRWCAVAPHTPIKKVAHVLAETGLPAAPVVSATGSVLGTVTPLDIVRAQDGGPRPGRHTAAEVMTRHPVTIGADTPVGRAARLLTERRTTHLVVLDGAGAVLGVLGRRDLLVPLCRPDGEIEADAASTVDGLAPGAGGSVRVHVRDGIVHLTGTLAGQPDGGRIHRALRDVPGVIDVRDELLHPDATTTGRHR